jgi:hypothetical protein
MLRSHPRFSGFNFVSRRGAEDAESAEGGNASSTEISAAFASSAPLREILFALRAGASA